MQPVNEGHSLLLKSSDDLMIGGYASIEIVDKQNDLITLKALEEAVDKFMAQDGFRNVMTHLGRGGKDFTKEGGEEIQSDIQLR